MENPELLLLELEGNSIFINNINANKTLKNLNFKQNLIRKQI
jgi:hypothetical protein